MKMRLMLVLCAGLALTVGIATASAADGGNSDNAKLCQQGGWEDLLREDGTPFKNVGDCLSYAAQGGELSLSAAATCASVGGTYSTDPSTAGPASVLPDFTFLWTCNGVNLVAPGNAQYDAVWQACSDSSPGNNLFVWLTGGPPYYSTCTVHV